MTYAADTSVPVSRSKAEVEDILTRYGAQAFASGWDQTRAWVEFIMGDRRIRMVVPLPAIDSPAFTRTASGKARTGAEAIRKAWEQACRSRWRALALVLKAQCEAVEVGIVTFDAAWLSFIVLPDGTTVGERALPQVALAYSAPSNGVTLELGP